MSSAFTFTSAARTAVDAAAAATAAAVASGCDFHGLVSPSQKSGPLKLFGNKC